MSLASEPRVRADQPITSLIPQPASCNAQDNSQASQQPSFHHTLHTSLLKMTIATKSSRSAMGFLNLWTTDKGTFPIVLIAGFAAVAAVGNATRYLLTHPDVCLDKAKRENSMHYSDEAGADWRARRFRFANISRNAINQSHQYDDLFAKAENQGVKR